MPVHEMLLRYLPAGTEFTRTATVRMAGLETELCELGTSLKTKHKCYLWSVACSQDSVEGAVLLDVTPCRWECSFLPLEGSHFILLKVISPERRLLGLFDAKVKELCIFESSEITRSKTQRHAQKNRRVSSTAVNLSIIWHEESNCD